MNDDIKSRMAYMSSKLVNDAIILEEAFNLQKLENKLCYKFNETNKKFSKQGIRINYSKIISIEDWKGQDPQNGMGDIKFDDAESAYKYIKKW